MGMRNEFNFRWENPVLIRCCQYLNNVVEQDHRRIKSRVQPMLGFKKFSNARRVDVRLNRMTAGATKPACTLICCELNLHGFPDTFSG
jgi:transposase-like protein